MLDGTVLAWKRHYLPGVKHWPRNVIQWLIVMFTGHAYVHLAVYCQRATYESTGVGGWGAKRTFGVLECDERWEPSVPLTDGEVVKATIWTAKQLRKKRPYNLLKFLCFPLRGLWRLLKWAPFDAPGWGEVCFTFVDEWYLAAGRDYVKGRRGYVTAWEFLYSGGFRRVA